MTMLITLIILSIAYRLQGTDAARCDRPGVVCGTDGRTYKTICQLKRAKTEDPDLQPLYSGRCTKRYYSHQDTPYDSYDYDDFDRHKLAKRQLSCPYIASPICGSNGQTYMNECHLTAKSREDPTLHLEYIGSCNDQSNRPFFPNSEKRHWKDEKHIYKSKTFPYKDYNINNNAKNHNNVNIGNHFEAKINIKNDAKNYNNVRNGKYLETKIDIRNHAKILNDINVGFRTSRSKR